MACGDHYPSITLGCSAGTNTLNYGNLNTAVGYTALGTTAIVPNPYSGTFTLTPNYTNGIILDHIVTSEWEVPEKLKSELRNEL